MVRCGYIQAEKEMSLFRRRDPFNELRKSPRFELHYLAQIDTDGAAPLTCMICDISAEGAKLTLPGDHPIPDEFTLLFRRRCRIVRHYDGQIGVKFVHA